MTFQLILQAMFFECFNVIPNILLAVLPFHKCLRFGRRTFAFMTLILYSLLVISRLVSRGNLNLGIILTLLWVILYLSFYRITMRLPSAKLLFVMLTLLHYASFISILHSYFVYHRLGFDGRTYSTASIFILAFLYLISFPFLYWLISKKMEPVITGSMENKYWNFLWLVPATFCMAYYYTIANYGGVIRYSAKPSNVIFAVCYNLGALFVTFLVLQFVAESNNALYLKAENYRLSMQALQYQSMTARIEEARRAKHDLRQNLTVIMAYLTDQDYDGLSLYLKNYLGTLPGDTPIRYCDNYALNALLVYYESIATVHGISCQISIETEATDFISETDTVILFGNLLENAVEACRRQAVSSLSSPSLSVIVTSSHDILGIQIENSHAQLIRLSGELFLSTKTNQPGIGLASVKEIVSRYNGTLDFQYDTHRFCVMILLNRQINQTSSRKSL